MTFPKMLMITGIILLSLSTGYFPGQKKIAALVALGVLCAFYVVVFLGE